MNRHLITLITLGILAISQFNVLKCTPVSDSDSKHDQIQISSLNRIESQPEVDDDAISSDKQLLNSYIKHLFDEKSNNDDELRILAHNLKSALEYKNQFEDEQEEEQSEQEQDLDKRAANSYLRFGRNGPAYLRFGRAQAYLRFGKRAPNSYLRFGKRNPAYLRFGRK